MKPRLSLRGDGGLAELLADLEAELDGLVAGPLRAHDLEQRHHLGAVEEVEPEEALGPLGRRGLRRPRRARRCWWRSRRRP